MTLGDVLAVIAAVAGVAAAWGCTLLVVALLLPAKAAAAGGRVEARPWACLGWGFLLSVVAGGVAAGMMRLPGPAKLLGWALLTALALLAALGSAGIARLLGERIQSTGTAMTPFASMTRGTTLYVAAGVMPVVGWFLVLPLALLISIGGGLLALLRQPGSHSHLPAHVGPEISHPFDLSSPPATDVNGHTPEEPSTAAVAAV